MPDWFVAVLANLNWVRRRRLVLAALADAEAHPLVAAGDARARWVEASQLDPTDDVDQVRILELLDGLWDADVRVAEVRGQ